MKINYKLLLICIVVPLFVGFIGGFFTSSSVDSWYNTLQKPSLNPPSWVFGPVWTLLYILMGIAFYVVLMSKSKLKKKAISLFSIQLVFNLAWSFLFFYFQNPFFALIEIIILWILILATMIYFFIINKKAGWLLVPYLAWVSFATYLNFSIWRLNG